MADNAKVRQVNDQAQAVVEGALDPKRSLVEQIVDEMGVSRSEKDAFETTKVGVGEVLRYLLSPDVKEARADGKVINELITSIDRTLNDYMDQILHNDEFQQLESGWRGLKFLVDRTDFRENIELELINASKDDLIADFEDATEIPTSGLYKLIYSGEYGTFGGNPFAAMIGNFEFGPGAVDIKLLGQIASVGTMAHAPFIAAASPKFFWKGKPDESSKDFLRLPNLKDIADTLNTVDHTKWHSFRETGDARSVGLVLPRFLLRLPYHHEANPTRSFQYDETVTDHHSRYLWGNAAFAFATRLTESFAKYRWCPNIIGPTNGGTVEDLPVHVFDSMGASESMIPTEALISDRMEFEISEAGFIPFTFRKDSDNACFFSANSVQLPQEFGQSEEQQAAEANFKLGTQLPYTFLIGRLAHYIKVLQREQLGGTMSREGLETHLNKWISQYVANYEAQAPVRARKPLRGATITVSDVENDPGWYRVQLDVTPHFKYMGAYFTLSLVGRIDKKAPGGPR